MPYYFYFDQDGQKQGPVDEQQLQTLITQGIIKSETQLKETESGGEWKAGQIPSLKFPQPTSSNTIIWEAMKQNVKASHSWLLPILKQSSEKTIEVAKKVAAQATEATKKATPHDQSAMRQPNTQSSGTLPTVKDLDSYCRRYSVSAVTLTLLGVLMGFITMLPGQVVYVVIGLCFTNLVVWAVCWCLLLYNLWKLIPVGIARTTPGKAVGLSMIPFYNFYWIFVSVLGLCKDTNTILRQYGIRHRINEGLGTIYCVLFCASLLLDTVPVLGTLIDMAGCAAGIILFRSLVDSSTALLERKDQPSFTPEHNTNFAAVNSSVSPTASKPATLPAPSPGSSSVFQQFTSAVKGAVQTTTPSGLCSDCNAETKKGEFFAYCLPEHIRRGKESLCPNCVEKYTILCPKCGLDWHVNVEKGFFDCPICDLSQAFGCVDISHVLHQSEASLSRIPQMSSKEDIVTAVGAIYRRGHPKYLDPMGGFLVLAKTGCYFLGPIDPDAPEMGHRDIFMPFASIITVSALGDGVHVQKRKQGFSHSLATVTEVTQSAARTIPILGSLMRQGTTKDTPPPKNRLTIAYKESGRLTVMFDIVDVSDEAIEKTAPQFRKQLLGFASQFGVAQKSETPRQSSDPAPTASEPTCEKYRIFRDGKLLGMITASEIGEKHTAKVLNDADFVLLPLETFLTEIETPGRPFQLFRDGKRIDQYTLQQIKELHASGQTQPIDHVLVPMPVFLDRKSS